jgi:glutathionylspermidine synthase
MAVSYGRFDLCDDGNGPAKLLEYNADTPTSLFEAAVFQWNWLNDAIAQHIVPHDADQFNSLHERLIEGWKPFVSCKKIHLVGMLDDPEDAGTLTYLEDTARQAGATTRMVAIDKIGLAARGVFVDDVDAPIDIAFKLYPWEWMFREKFGAYLPGSSTRWIEPPWKAILSNKGILPLLWQMFPQHPNLLPAFFEDDPQHKGLGDSYVRKPLHSREGANVEIVIGGDVVDANGGPYKPRRCFALPRGDEPAGSGVTSARRRRRLPTRHRADRRSSLSVKPRRGWSCSSWSGAISRPCVRRRR